MQSLIEDTETHPADLISPPDQPKDKTLRRFTRLLLKDDMTSQYRPILASLDGEELHRLPHDRGRSTAESGIDPRNCSISTYDPRASRIEETLDYPEHPCQIAGCSSGPYECKKHRRRSSQAPAAYKHTFKGDVSAVAHHIADDIAQIGHTIRDATLLSHTQGNHHNKTGVTEPQDETPSSTVVNPPLPGLVGHELSAQAEKPSPILPELSEASLKPLPKSPSIRTGASGKSARHALLKPSVSQSPFDNKLPVPPILTPVAIKPKEEVLEPRTGTSFASLTRMDSHDLAPKDTASLSSAPAETKTQKPLPDVPSTIEVAYVVKAETKTISNPHFNEQSSAEPVALIPPPTLPAVPTRSDSLSSEYWGFVPAVKEAVNDAVQVAVRRAVNEVVVPPGIQKDQASAAYRKLVGASLAKAALIADDYLRRPSLWEESSANESMENLKLPYAPPMDTVPLESADEAVGENFRPGWKITVPWKKDSSHVYDAIPTRDSSRKDALKSKIKGANSAAIAALKAIGSRKRSSSETSPESTKGTSIDVENGTQHSAAGDRDDHLPTREHRDPKVISSNTAHWVRELLSSEGPYETRLTELPPRERRERSLTAPAKPVLDLFLDEPVKIVDLKLSIPKSDSLINFEKQQIAASETFTKTLSDLEHLLNEAMVIARQAAEEEDAPYVPRLLETATEILKGGLVRQESKAAIKSIAFSNDHRRGNDASMHESLRSYISSSGSETDEYAIEDPQVPHIRIKAPDGKIVISTKISRKVKTVPSFGRRFTPYPPDLPSQPVSHSATDSQKNLDSGAKATDEGTVSTGEASPNKVDCAPLTHEERCNSLPIAPSTPRRLGTKAMKSGRLTEYDSRHFEGVSPVPRKGDVSEYITANRHPPIQPRRSSWRLNQAKSKKGYAGHNEPIELESVDLSTVERLPPGMIHTPYSHSFDGSVPSDALDFEAGYVHKQATRPVEGPVGSGRGVELRDIPAPNLPEHTGARHRRLHLSASLFDLHGKSHVSIKGEHRHGFSLTRSHKRQAIARDWSPARKRFVATVACISTALIGLLTGIYAAEVPSIQYYIVDFHHYTILGNVFFFVGLAMSTFVFWPLPLLHGRKPYTLSAMCLAMPLLFPQALVVGGFRSPYVSQWRVALLLPRALMGLVLGMANMNFQLTLTDVFGASLQSTSPHQEMVDKYDVRRHGGGMGMWLGIWTWCQVASGGIGFLIGAAIINSANPAWGFYVSICIIAGVLLLNIVSPEVRRAAFRRSVAEVKDGEQVSRRLARGEVKMHMVQNGPKWWGQEFYHGFRLSGLMLRQPGFLVMALYVAWIYGQIVLTVVVSSERITSLAVLTFLASRVSDVQVLPLQVSICRCECYSTADWRFTVYSFPESRAV
jgi:MFS family permease